MGKRFEKYYLDTFDSVFRFVLSRSNSKEDCEDLVSSIYLKAYKSFYEGRPKQRAWIFTIASNSLKNYYRDRKESQRLPENLIGQRDLEGHILKTERAEELILAIRKLNEEDQKAISLRFFGELSYRELAKVMDISLSAAKTRVSRALVKLRDILGEELL